MVTLYYHCPAELLKLMDKAAWAWDQALTSEDWELADFGRTRVKATRHRVMITAAPLRLANVIIRMGQVDRSRSPGRVAQHELRDGTHFITLAADVSWRVTWWQRVAGIGQEDAYAALLHELGHALGLPHSDRESDVMAPDLGSTVISRDEAERYRRFLDTPATTHLLTTPPSA